MKANSWIIGIVGLWIVVSSFLSVNPQFILWSNLIAGVIIGIAGFTMAKEKPGFGWVAGILGVWMVISAFIPVLHIGTGLLWNGILAGAISAIDGFSSLSSTPSHTQTVQ